MKTLLLLFLSCLPVMAQMPCTDDCPEGGTNNSIMPGPWTNVVGMPIVRIVSIHGSDLAANLGSLICTNYGFNILSNQVTASQQVFTVTNAVVYYHFTLGAINTSTNRRYAFLFAYEYLDGTYVPLETGWNGLGTNEHALFDYIVLASNADIGFFKLKDIGPAQ